MQTGRPLKEHAPGEMVTIGVQIPGLMKSELMKRAFKEQRTLSKVVISALTDRLGGPLAVNCREYGLVGGQWACSVGLLFQDLERAKDGRHGDAVAADMAAYAKKMAAQLRAALDAEIAEVDAAIAERKKGGKP